MSASPLRPWQSITLVYVIVLVIFVILAVGTGTPYPDDITTPALIALAAAVLRAAHGYLDRHIAGRGVGRLGRHDLVRWLAVGCGGLSVPYLLWFTAQHTISPEFFTASAQVIPVLLVALLVDVSRSEASRTLPLVWVIVYAFIGEGLALTSEASARSAGPAAFAIVASSIIAVAFALIFTILWSSGNDAGSAQPSTSHPSGSGDEQ